MPKQDLRNKSRIIGGRVAPLLLVVVSMQEPGLPMVRGRAQNLVILGRCRRAANRMCCPPQIPFLGDHGTHLNHGHVTPKRVDGVSERAIGCGRLRRRYENKKASNSRQDQPLHVSHNDETSMKKPHCAMLGPRGANRRLHGLARHLKIVRLPGRATPEATSAYADAHPMPKGHYRNIGGLTMSSVGHGSYLGNVEPEARVAYEEAALTCLNGGVNVLDTSSNYRNQASERDVGRALHRFVDGGGDRSGVVVATKAGFLHGDCDSELEDGVWIRDTYADDGTLAAADVIADCHSLKPAYLERELDRSRDNLGLECVDVFFVHNPETQLAAGVDEAEWLAKMEDAFVALERRADAGDVKVYGIATWDGLRVPPGPGHIPLVKLVHAAGQAAMSMGKKASEHRFRAIELPLNLAMQEASQQSTQEWKFGHSPALACAKDIGMLTFASASMMQAKLRGRVPPEWSQALGIENDLETCLQFTRSVPGVGAALVGMGRPEHATEVLAWLAARGPDGSTVKTMLGSGYGHD
jgi:aryl-alcohol dehydrogenase-like predicted oxidoreductase